MTNRYIWMSRKLTKHRRDLWTAFLWGVLTGAVLLGITVGVIIVEHL